MKVWNSKDESWVELKPWMRWCPHIWTNGIDWIRDK